MKTVDDRAEFNKSNINCTDGIVHSNFELPVANVAVKLILSEMAIPPLGLSILYHYDWQNMFPLLKRFSTLLQSKK